MALTLQQFKDLFAAIDAETTRIADRIAELLANQSKPGLTEAEEAEIKTMVDAELAKLRTIGTTEQPPADGGSQPAPPAEEPPATPPTEGTPGAENP